MMIVPRHRYHPEEKEEVEEVEEVEETEMSTITMTYVPCKHDNGFYTDIPWWFWRRNVFCCDDCNTVLCSDTWKKV